MSQEEYLRELAGRVCIHMPGWDVGNVQPTAFQLNGADGRGIIFWAGGGQQAEMRLEVSGVYDLNTYINNEDKKRITVRASRGGQAIAKDVQRRFLPKYEAIYAEALKTHNEIIQAREARARVMAYLAQELGWKVIADQKGKIKRIQEQPYGSNADAILGSSMRPPEIDGQWYVDLELKRIPIGYALRIAEVLKEPVFPPEQLTLL